MKQSEEILGDLFLILSFCSVVLAGVGASGYDIWLASTQWMLIAAVLALYAIYIQLKK